MRLPSAQSLVLDALYLVLVLPPWHGITQGARRSTAGKQGVNNANPGGF
jgi:hypothetical protein